jgi:hypothetical protein
MKYICVFISHLLIKKPRFYVLNNDFIFNTTGRTLYELRHQITLLLHEFVISIKTPEWPKGIFFLLFAISVQN